jgi:hypothetical protein
LANFLRPKTTQLNLLRVFPNPCLLVSRTQISQSDPEWLSFSPNGDLLNPTRSQTKTISASSASISALSSDSASVGKLTISSGAQLSSTATTTPNSLDLASTSYVDSAIAALIGSAPSLLNTLQEIDTALGNDPSFSNTVTNQLAQKGSLSGANTWTGKNTFSGSVVYQGADLGVRLQTDEVNILNNTNRLDVWDSSWNSFLANPSLSSLAVAGNAVVGGSATVSGALSAPSLSLGGRDLSSSLQTLSAGIATNASGIATINSQIPTFALDSSCVHLTGSETIGGTKTFFSVPVVGTRSQGDNSTKEASTAYCDAGLALKANLSNPVFTGTLTCQSISDNGALWKFHARDKHDQHLSSQFFIHILRSREFSK